MKDPSEKKQVINATAAKAFNAFIFASPKYYKRKTFYDSYKKRTEG